ncbi:MAG: BatD family protein, partial [Chitinispirillaceae bacterium]|nr:BatD family protein [Chitinispirillaceae bacterium]
TIDGTEYSTDPITFTVVDQPVSNPDVKAFLSLSKKILYPGEQVILTFKIAQRVQAQGSIDIRGGFNGAVEKIEAAFSKNFAVTRLFTNQVTSSSERIEGELYNVYSLRFSIVPVNAGSYSIPSIPFEYQELHRTRRRSIDPFFDDFFDMNIFGSGVQAVAKTAFTSPFTIEVKSLPSPPSQYSGAVGSFSLKAVAEPLEVPAGEAVTLKIMLKGNTRPGNMGEIEIPKRDDYEIFTPEKQITVDTGETGISTKKNYKYLLIPKREGILKIEPINFIYFDPISGNYKNAQTDTITIKVTKGKEKAKAQGGRYLTQEEIREIGRDIRYIKTNVSIKNQHRYPYRNPVFILLFPLPLILSIFSILYKYQAIHKTTNIAAILKKKAYHSALKKLEELKKKCFTMTVSDFVGALTDTIEAYITYKFGFSAKGLTIEELRNRLNEVVISKEKIEKLVDFIERLNSYSFGGVYLDKGEYASLAKNTGDLLTEIESSLKKGGEKNE